MDEVLVCGRVKLIRKKCPRCDEFYLASTVDHPCPDCDIDVKDTRRRTTRTLARNKRRATSRDALVKMIDKQGGACYWCGRKFYIQYLHKNSVRSLLPNADHVLPFSYTNTNNPDGFVAACAPCNTWKGAKIFADDDSARVYLLRKWEMAIFKKKFVF